MFWPIKLKVNHPKEGSFGFQVDAPGYFHHVVSQNFQSERGKESGQVNRRRPRDGHHFDRFFDETPSDVYWILLVYKPIKLQNDILQGTPPVINLVYNPH